MFWRSVGSTAAVLALSTSGCGWKDSHEIEIRGSDSEVNLVQRIAEMFTERHGTPVAIAGGGSGTGIAALLGGTVDIANSSRELKPIEKLLALRKEVHPVATIFATDALTVIVHADNPLSALTVEQIGRLFDGTARRWGDVGGADEPVIPYGRQSSSGTYVFFRDAVLGGKSYSHLLRQMNGNAQIVEGVARDPRGVGYVAVGYMRSSGVGVRTLSVKTADGDAIDPLDRSAVRKGRYPIARPLYQFTRGEPKGAVREFLSFELSSQAEPVIEAMGFYPIVDEWRVRNAHLKGAVE